MEQTVYYRPQPVQPLRLYCYCGGRFLEHTVGPECTLGRTATPGVPCLVIDHCMVSQRHGRILPVDGRYQYCDLDSTNGTWINDTLYGRRANSNCPAAKELAHGDVLRIGQPENGVVLIAAQVYGDTVWQRIPLGGDVEELEIGRSAGNDALRLADAAVSRRHALFFRAGERWAIQDNNSLNGVFLNNQRIGQPVYLQPLDVVRIADSFFLFDGEGLWYQAPARPDDGPGA